MSGWLHRIGYSAVFVASLATTSSFAAEADSAHGETLAKRWCASCHLVGADQKRATTDAPPFAAVANRPDFSSAKLAFFLLDPHPKMPNMALSRTEAADIAAYIATLGPHQNNPQPAPPPPSRRGDAADKLIVMAARHSLISQGLSDRSQALTLPFPRSDLYPRSNLPLPGKATNG